MPGSNDTPSVTTRALERVGSTVQQKYRINQLLGIGGMAAVYAATHRNGHRVAIKFLLDHFRDEPELSQLFRREAYVANQVGHPGAVPVLDDDVDGDGCAFLVMPLLEGETLGTRWARAAGRQLPVAEVCVLMLDALDILTAAHAKGIVHRDIKQDNLFVTFDGMVRILDFGIAWHRDHAALPERVLGTPVFMPPEQARGDLEASGPHSDCWALGATMFALLSGEFVHPLARSMAPSGEHFSIAATQQARSLGDAMPDLPESIVQFVDKALAFDPKARWPEARAMREALAETSESVLRQPITTVAPCVRTLLSAELSSVVETPRSSADSGSNGSGHSSSPSIAPLSVRYAAPDVAASAAKNLVTLAAETTRVSPSFQEKSKGAQEKAWQSSPERRRELLSSLDALLPEISGDHQTGLLFQLEHIEDAIIKLCKQRLLDSLGRGGARTLANVIRIGDRTLILKFRSDLERDRLLHVLLQDTAAPHSQSGPAYTHTEIDIANSIGRYESLQVSTPASLGAAATDAIHAHIFDAFTTGYFWLAEQVNRALTSLTSPFEAETLQLFRRQFFIHDRAAAADKAWLVMVSQERVYYAVDHQVVAEVLRSGQASTALQQAPASIATVLLANSISLGRSFSRQAIEGKKMVEMCMQKTPYEEVAQDFLLGQTAIYDSDMLLTPLVGDERGWLLAAHPSGADVQRVLRAATPVLERHFGDSRVGLRPPIIRRP